MDQKPNARESSNLSTLVTLTLKESLVLKLIRAKKFNRIEIEMKDGEPGQIYVDEEISAENAKFDDIIRGNPFQTITFTQHDGSLVRIKRRTPIKLD
jgi:hypothetical protein